MNCSFSSLHREEGYVLVVALMIMTILTLIGIAGLNTSRFEEQIAGNEWNAKKTFYQADGGAELAERLIFENAVCSYTQSGFTAAKFPLNSRIAIETSTMSFSEDSPTDTTVTDANRWGAYYPGATISDTKPHTNFLSTFTTKLNPGAGQQMISGYEGLAVGAAGGGTSRLYVISSQHLGFQGSENLIETRWRLDNFVIANAASSDCEF